MMNTLPNNFLTDKLKGKPNEIGFVELKGGYLKMKYDEDGALIRVAFVLSKEEYEPSVGKQLEFSLDQSMNGTVTYIEEMGAGGFQWSEGKVIWGSTYDEVPSSPTREISLNDWLNECLREIINPSQEQIKIAKDE
ncbi:MAG: hypothetical protein RIT04_563 [Candidatus Parcubacteria bacterium]|jgi:hypothetical protein